MPNRRDACIAARMDLGRSDSSSWRSRDCERWSNDEACFAPYDVTNFMHKVSFGEELENSAFGLEEVLNLLVNNPDFFSITCVRISGEEVPVGGIKEGFIYYDESKRRFLCLVYEDGSAEIYNTTRTWRGYSVDFNSERKTPREVKEFLSKLGEEFVEIELD